MALLSSWRVVFVVVAVLAAVGLELAAAKDTVAVGERWFQQQQEALAVQVAQQVAEELAAARRVLANIAADEAPADPALLAAWLAGQEAIYDLETARGLRLCDRSGTVLASLGSPPGAGPTSDLEICDRCALVGEVLRLQGQPDAVGRRVELDLSLRVMSERLFAHVRSGQEGYAWMLGPGGVVLGNPDRQGLGTRPFGAADRSLVAMVRDMEAGGQGSASYAWEERRRLAAYAPVAGARLSVAVSADSEEISAGLRESLRLQAGAGLAVLGVLLVAGAALWSEQRRHFRTQQRALVERVALRDAAAHADRLALLGTLTAGVAHELRSPLTVLVMLEEELERGGLEPELCRLYAEAVATLRTLSSDMTDFARQGDPGESRCDPALAVEAALRMARPRLRARHRLHVDLDELPWVAMAPGRLSQVVINLVLNAADALEAGGTIWIRGRAEGDRVLLRVEDDGPGIAPAQRDRLFEAFATTKARGEGTGLGLYLCRSMVEEVGGTIGVDPNHAPGAAFEVGLVAQAGARRLASAG